MANYGNRIIGEGEEAPDQLLANPFNFRRHPKEQLDALDGALSEIGWIQRVIVNKTTGHMIDGHARVEIAIRKGEPSVPVLYVDLTEREEKIALATFDPISGLAYQDEETLRQLLDGLDAENGALQSFMQSLVINREQEKIDQMALRTSLNEQFLVPPFSILDARQGYWADRKRKWLSVGIKSELGRGQDGDKGKGGLTYSVSAQPPDVLERKRELEQRDGRAYTWSEFAETYPDEITLAGDSIFDPVLCEVGYRWFAPQGGSILDPFAGGSVRGIVAGLLGYHYIGIDLRQEQVEANRANWLDVKDAGKGLSQDESAPVEVKVSSAMARLKFAGCSPEYIASTCHAHCCESSTSSTGTVITIHPSEEAAVISRGARVVDGLLQPRPGEKKCPFKNEQNLCGIHFTPDKPFGCIASPFTINDKGTLIVRNRYKVLKCYKDGDQIPAYKAFRASLNLIFGESEAQRICEHFDAGGKDLLATMPRESFNRLRDNDAIKHGNAGIGEPTFAAEPGDPVWINSDSRALDAIETGKVDCIFSCPPYADLEVYSDDPRDISNMDYEQFIAIYREIIAKSCAKLSDNRFAVFVVGDVRDRKGNYRNFVGDTVQAFVDAGLTYYNEAILITPTGSLAMRAGNMFRASRKVGKAHQNVLIFAKGEPEGIDPIRGMGEALSQQFAAHRNLLAAHEKVLVFAKGDAKLAAQEFGAVLVSETEE